MPKSATAMLHNNDYANHSCVLCFHRCMHAYCVHVCAFRLHLTNLKCISNASQVSNRWPLHPTNGDYYHLRCKPCRKPSNQSPVFVVPNL